MREISGLRAFEVGDVLLVDADDSRTFVIDRETTVLIAASLGFVHEVRC